MISPDICSEKSISRDSAGKTQLSGAGVREQNLFMDIDS